MSDYKRATIKACEFLLNEDIYTFPLDLKRIINNRNYYLLTYTEAARLSGCTYNNLKHALKKSWGTVAYNGNGYAIMYDDKLAPGAQLFTLAHEIGHIELEHLTLDSFSDGVLHVKPDMDEISKNEIDVYEQIENEANCFARNILCPVSVVEEISDYELSGPILSDLYIKFGITQKAYETRMSEYIYSEDIKNIPHNTHNNIVKKFYRFIMRMQDTADKEYEEYITKQIGSGEFYATSSTIYSSEH